MALTPEPNNNSDELIGKEHRDRVISTLPLSKQFYIRQRLSDCDGLTKDQAIELLKECIVQSAQKDEIYNKLIKQGF